MKNQDSGRKMVTNGASRKMQMQRVKVSPKLALVMVALAPDWKALNASSGKVRYATVLAGSKKINIPLNMIIGKPNPVIPLIIPAKANKMKSVTYNDKWNSPIVKFSASGISEMTVMAACNWRLGASDLAMIYPDSLTKSEAGGVSQSGEPPLFN